jgi:hypothetical protein
VARNLTARLSAFSLLLVVALWPARGYAATNTVVTLSVSGYQQIGQPLKFAAQVTPTSPS